MMFVIRAPTPEEIAEAATLVGTWFQVSRRYRHVARLPEGSTPKDAIRSVMGKHRGLPEREILPHEEKWLDAMSDDAAGEFFLRVYARYYENLYMTLSVALFEAFRAVGGDTYEWYMYRNRKTNVA